MCIVIFFRQKTEVGINGQEIPPNVVDRLTTWATRRFHARISKAAPAVVEHDQLKGDGESVVNLSIYKR